MRDAAGNRRISPLNVAELPGHVDPSLYNTCFDYMGVVTFSSAYKFITGKTSGTIDGYVGPAISNTNNRMYGFSIPLVGDLNHDGYPEIVSTGLADGTSGLSASVRYIYIHDGRTGAEILKYSDAFGSGWNGRQAGYHDSPSHMALVDADRDGRGEIIVAYGYNSSSNYSKRLMSFEVDTAADGHITGLHPKWPSWSAPYYAGSGSGTFSKPIPQVVDMDHDGVAEVVVYNKIYNARNGDLLLVIDSLAMTNTGMTGSGANRQPVAHVGKNAGNSLDDDQINFSYIYDMDLDGNYDLVAGGRVYYDITLGTSPATSSFKKDSIDGVNDGRTGVADVDGDGIPDVVTVYRDNRSTGTSNNNTGTVIVTVWDPGFLRVEQGTVVRNSPPYTPAIKAQITVPLSASSTGNNSYVYIGDIDGREQLYNGKNCRLPEIAILGRGLTKGTAASPNPYYKRFPGLSANEITDGLPLPGTDYTSGTEGVLMALTWDLNAAGTADDPKLKVSFLMEHGDESVNTGFTMFDFDNDGTQEICYRDMLDLRIIKAKIPCVKLNYVAEGATGTQVNRPDVILFKRSVRSYTGFEYPVIADIDDDASADIVVMGRNQTNNHDYSFLYAVGNGAKDKFASALPVWNQFMYDPFKIHTDLTTPTWPAVNRLDPQLRLRREIKDADNVVIRTITDYNPFNGTLIQGSYFDKSLLPDFEPIVFLTEAYIASHADVNAAKRPGIVTEGKNHYMDITVGNRSTAETNLSALTPLAVYRGNRIEHASRMTFSLDTLINTETGRIVGNVAISPGSEIRVRIPIPDPTDVYIVRLGDSSEGTTWSFGINRTGDTYASSEFNQGIGRANRAFRDCYWPDQVTRVARYGLFDDLLTVQEFRSVELDFLANDQLPELPENNFFSSFIPSNSLVTLQPKAGAVTVSGAGRDSRIIYQHTGVDPTDGAPVSLTHAIDSFRYRLTYVDETVGAFPPGTLQTGEATVYVYVMESTAGAFVACYGATVNIELADKPEHIRFDWYRSETSGDLTGQGRTRTMDAMTGDSVFWLKPDMSGLSAVNAPRPAFYKSLDFPRGELTVPVVTHEPGATATLRWTGMYSSEWKDPANWVEIRHGAGGQEYEMPVLWTPASCVDIIVPSGVERYPELTAPVICRNIAMKDRALLKNPHLLQYDSVQVELKPNPLERDRFIMISAPLKDMYSGDYYLGDNNPLPRWGDTYMNLFQQANPASGGKAEANRFTATFGRLDQSLPQGTAFNLRVTTTTATKDAPWIFPRTNSYYMSGDGVRFPASGNFQRAEGHRFIINDAVLLPDTTFAITVTGDLPEGNLVQVVNPYFAFLDVTKFLRGNSASLSQAGYITWDGYIDNSFTAVSTQGNRYLYTSPAPSSTPNLIQPLQSFFVQKSHPGSTLSSVRMSPNWTTTKRESQVVFRAAAEAEEHGVLRIKATQGTGTSYAILQYHGDASPDFRSDEDIRTLFYDEIPLTLYSLTDRKEALSIQASNDFHSRQTDLGLRVRNAGEVKLTFSELETFGHDVYLTDRERNVEINLREHPEYTFTLSLYMSPDRQPVELNDRFSLRMDYTGAGLATHQAVASSCTVSASEGAIHVHSTSGLIRDLQIYAMNGVPIYGRSAAADHFRVPVQRGQTYVVKIRKEDETYEVRKVWVQ
ncbi:MAG: VCBS repeat-containing protein [Tannerella sp.]|nr:VCBS repeat-containing protein [Tannerella sp.]